MSLFMSLNSLFGQDVNGKTKEWKISVSNKETHSVIETSFGYIDGKKSINTQIVDKGKNIGKKNETGHYEQAVLIAKSKWKKKMDSGYSQTREQEKKDQEKPIQNSIIEKPIENEIIFPMLANDFNKRKDKISFPLFVQPKLDGYRMIYNSSTKYCNSRQGKEFDILRKTDLYQELIKIDEGIILDGELYVHNGVFEHLGMLRKKKLSGNDLEKLNTVEYHVYDIIISDKAFKARHVILQDFFTKNTFTKIKLVKTEIVHDQKSLDETHLNFVQDNYEGSIVRTKNGLYRCKARSNDLLKYKDFMDDEFEITDFTFEMDTFNEHIKLVVWICKTKDNQTFNVRPKGTKIEREMLFKKAQEYIGQKLHVKFFEMTENNIPRFPTTKSDSYTTYIRNVIE